MSRIVEGCVWALVCALVWLATASSVTGQEVLLAALAGVVGGVAAVAGRVFARNRWALRAAWFRRAVRLPAAVVLATATVLAATLRRRPRRGQLATVRPRLEESPEVADSHFALSSIAFAAAPTGYVVDADPDEGEVTVHRLADRVPSWARVGLSEQ